MVGRRALAMRFTNVSRRMRYSMSAFTVTILSLWSFANLASSGTRAMVPSSFIISQMTPAGCSPANLARSTDPSVWPARFNTPPFWAFNGKICPGRARSLGLLFGSIATCTVVARSAAEIPVVMSLRASIDTVNAVPNVAVFSTACWGNCSSSTRSGVRARQINPRACRAMKMMACGVTFSAAITRSPSFSRSSSSTRITNLPFLMSRRASSMLSNGVGIEDFQISGFRLKIAGLEALQITLFCCDCQREKGRPRSVAGRVRAPNRLGYRDRRNERDCGAEPQPGTKAAPDILESSQPERQQKSSEPSRRADETGRRPNLLGEPLGDDLKDHAVAESHRADRREQKRDGPAK